jgi:heavy metal translocating P-type ATPase
VSTFTHTGSVYYEIVAILIVVHTAGKMLGARSRVAALRAVFSTREKFDCCDVVQPDGSVKRVPVSAVPLGGSVRVSPGAPISIDGEIVSGSGYIQETAMTGEWKPVTRGVGDPVLAGTYSVDGTFEIRPRPGQRKIDAILQQVEQARLAPSALQEQSDRLMRWFLPLVVGTSGVTFGYWLANGPWDRALFNAMAVLLVACPCAMGLATPVAVWGGLARLSQLGLIARSGDFLDRLSRATIVCLDKTGTLSGETVSAAVWTLRPDFERQAEPLKAAVAALEAGLNHPMAKAVRLSCSTSSTTKAALLERQIVPGLGVRGQVRLTDGELVDVAVGERQLGADVGEGVEGANGSVNTAAVSGGSAGKRISVFWNGKCAAELVLSETWRAGLAETLTELSELQLKTEILSGDPEAASALSGVVASAKGAGNVVISGGLTPLQKAQRVQALRQAGAVVAFAGDGLNDAAALSEADASIAVKSGTELARASAMAVMIGDDLRSLPAAVRVSRAVRRSIQSNLLFAAAYNIVGMILAALGKLHPVAAALLMLGSSVFVSVRALRGASRPM